MNQGNGTLPAKQLSVLVESLFGPSDIFADVLSCEASFTAWLRARLSTMFAGEGHQMPNLETSHEQIAEVYAQLRAQEAQRSGNGRIVGVIQLPGVLLPSLVSISARGDGTPVFVSRVGLDRPALVAGDAGTEDHFRALTEAYGDEAVSPVDAAVAKLELLCQIRAAAKHAEVPPSRVCALADAAERDFPKGIACPVQQAQVIAERIDALKPAFAVPALPAHQLVAVRNAVAPLMAGRGVDEFGCFSTFEAELRGHPLAVGVGVDEMDSETLEGLYNVLVLEARETFSIGLE